MGWTIWVKVENDDAPPQGDGTEGWCEIGKANLRYDAIVEANEMLMALERLGYAVSQPLDGWVEE